MDSRWCILQDKVNIMGLVVLLGTCNVLQDSHGFGTFHHFSLWINFQRWRTRMAAIKKIWRNFHVTWRHDHILRTSKETCWMYNSFFKFYCHIALMLLKLRWSPFKAQNWLQKGPNLVPRVHRLFGQRGVAWWDSGAIEFLRQKSWRSGCNAHACI